MYRCIIDVILMFFWHMAKQLNERQERFCQEYLLDGNATAAYIRAGYSDRGDNAHANAHRLMANDGILIRLQELRSHKLVENEKHRRQIIDFLWSIIKATISDFYYQDSEGNLKPKKLEDIEPEKLSAIASFDISSSGSTIKFHNKIAAIVQLRETLGLNSDLSKLILALNNYGHSGWIEDGQLKIQKDEV